MSKRGKKERRKKRSVASGSARRREKATQGYSDMFDLPEGKELFEVESVGTLRLDVIPYNVGKGNPNWPKDDYGYERTFFIHRGVGVNDDWVICPARTAKKPCPVCEFIAKMKNDPDIEEKSIDAIKVSKRMLLNVRDLKKDSDVVKVWHVSHAYFGKALDKALEAEFEDHEDNKDNFCDPEDGYYLKCSSEKGYQGRGFSIERVDFKSRKGDLDEDILEQAVCLDDILVMKDYDELEELLYAGTDDDDDADNDDDDDDDDDADDAKESRKKKSKKKKSSKKKKKPEPDDDDDDADDADDADDSDDADDDDDGDANGEDWNDDDDDDDNGDNWDDGDDDDEPVKKKHKKKKSKKKRRE